MAEDLQQVEVTKIRNFDELGVHVSYIRRDIKEIKDQITANYVTKNEFQPVRNLVYGMVGLILVAVVGALITLVLK